MLRDYFIYVIKNLRSRKMRSWLTMIGIFIGIAAVVSLISLGEGMKEAITSQFSSLGTDKLAVQASGLAFGPPGSSVVKKLTDQNRKAIENVNGVEIAVNRLIRRVKVEFNDEQDFYTISNLPEESKERRLVREVLNLDVAEGKWITKDDNTKVVIGNNFFSKKLFGKSISVGNRITIEGKQFQVAGILEKSGNPIFNTIIVMNEDPLRELLDIGDEVDLIAVQVKENADLDQVAISIEKVMRKERGVEKGSEDFSIQTPNEIIESVNTILTVVQAVLVGIAMISLLVGGIGIMNTMYTAVVERTREIGIMKAIGAKNRDILLLFLFESGFLGLMGGLIGVILGFTLSTVVEVSAANILGPTILQAQFSPVLIIGSLLFSFLVGTISGILPAKQAASLLPVEALRK